MKFLAYHKKDPLRDSDTGKIVVHGAIVSDGRFAASTVKRRFTHLKGLEKTKIPLLCSDLG